MRKWIAAMLVLLVVMGGSVGAWADAVGDDGHRVMLDAAVARAAGVAIRSEAGNGKVTAHISGPIMARLQRMGIRVETVPVRTISVSAAGRPQKSPWTSPTTQVPYGVKMVWGEPSLTTSQVRGGRGVTVAVLDTGAYREHHDFTRWDGSKVITGCVDFSQRAADQVEGTCADGHGHGTHVAGTVAGAGGADGKGIFGVAPEANILAYKVLSDRGSGYADDVARAIRVAADRGANIISMSLGSSTPSQLELDAIRYANSKGVLVIAAAGNSGPEANTIGFPGGFAEVVAVAALNPDETVAYFSSRGLTDGHDNSIVEREVEVAGPGRATVSTYRDGGYAVMSGTSMATPHIAGLAALIWTTASGTRSALVNSAKAHDITKAEQINNAKAGYDIASGYGLPQKRTTSAMTWSN